MNYTSADNELKYDGEFVYDPQDVEGYGAQGQHSRAIDWMWPVVALLLGTVFQMLAQEDIGPVILAPLFLGIGLGILAIPGLSDRLSRRAFVLTFCTLVFVAGINQVYHSFFFSDPRYPGILFSDETTFYGMVRTGLAGESLQEMMDRGFSGGGPVLIWQILYSICGSIGLGDGSWIGIMLNGLIVGLVANLTVRTARHLFGDDEFRLRRIGTLFALCGMFWMYGGTFLRDCFALLLVSLALWSLVRVTVTTNIKNLAIAAVILILAAVTMEFVREGISMMFVLFALLALVSLTRRWRSGLAPLVAMLVGLLVLITAFHYISQYVGAVTEYVEERAVNYGREEAILAGVTGGKSLADTLVVGQPMPIRLITGSLYMLIFPIPLWTQFSLERAGYWWMTGWNGVFIVLLTPAAIVGLFTAIKHAAFGGRRAPSLTFLSFFMIICLLSIAATSLKIRHMGQFWPALLMLAVIPDFHDPVERSKVKHAAMLWFGLVFFGHICWAALKLI